MRLLFVSHSLPPTDRPLSSLGGMQRVALELDAAFSEVEGLDYRTRFLRAPWRLIHVRVVPFLIVTLFRLAAQARRGDLEVVLFSSMVTAWLAVPLRGTFKRHGVFSAAIVHGLDVTTPSKPYQRFVPRVMAALDLVMPVSAATGEQCVARGLSPAKLRPVHNGVDVERFPVPAHGQAERRLSLARAFTPPPGDTVLICSVGRQVKRKGFAWFIRSVMPLLPGNVVYWLAGDGPEASDIADAISEATGEQDLGQRVRLLGRVSEEQLEALYQGADLFVMPNVPVHGDMEGFGVVMLESGLSGMPAVGARLEGVAEVINPGKNGLLVESGDAEGFRDAIVSLTSDAAVLEQSSRRAREYTAGRFAWPSVVDEYLEVLRSRLPG